MLPVDASVDPDIDDGIDCATTYILEPGSTTLQVYHSLFNGGPDRVNGPMGTIADTGGNTEAWTNARGFERADISALATLSAPEPSDFTVYQGPGVVVRHHPAPRQADRAHAGADRRRVDHPRRRVRAARHPQLGHVLPPAPVARGHPAALRPRRRPRRPGHRRRVPHRQRRDAAAGRRHGHDVRRLARGRRARRRVRRRQRQRRARRPDRRPRRRRPARRQDHLLHGRRTRRHLQRPGPDAGRQPAAARRGQERRPLECGSRGRLPEPHDPRADPARLRHHRRCDRSEHPRAPARGRRPPGVPGLARVRDVRPPGRRGHAAALRSAARRPTPATAPTR